MFSNKSFRFFVCSIVLLVGGIPLVGSRFNSFSANSQPSSLVAQAQPRCNLPAHSDRLQQLLQKQKKLRSKSRTSTPALAPGVTLTTLVNFNRTNNGSIPYASLIQGKDGNFYGTTAGGGSSNSGTVFRMTPKGQLTTLVNFDGTNGAVPEARLIQANDGNFYGTTAGGGSSSGGTVFRMTPKGRLTTLANFNCANGSSPYASLIQASDGNFYGTTYSGGSSDKCGSLGCGTVFRMTPTGRLTTLVNFDDANGARPLASLIQAKGGNFYGTTAGGGSSDKCDSFSLGCGTVFRMTPKGRLTTLVNFDVSNGAGPDAELIQARDGNFYGTTAGGGSFYYGTVFRMTPTGRLTTLVNLNVPNDFPAAGLIQAKDGNFYGTATGNEFSSGAGTVFRVTPKGRLKTLVIFDISNGSTPQDRVIQAKDGNFYGTTPVGGSSGDGTLFRLRL